MMKEKITPYLRQLSQSSAIHRQYWVENESLLPQTQYDDPLMEEKHEVVKGLIHKYTNRALIKVSYECAAHCRFCTRIRQIGDLRGRLQLADVVAIAQYLEQHTEVEDVILSGGDPFYTPKLSALLLENLRTIEHLRVFRLGTRLPLQLPGAFEQEQVLQLLALLEEMAQERPIYVLLHVEHPDELTEEAIKVIRQLRSYGLTLLSQTVFLRGINDAFEPLYRLFKQLYALGVQPYYLYHCDKVKGLEHFEGDLEEEKAIARQLRQALSGIACPLFVEDLAGGYGKIPIY